MSCARTADIAVLDVAARKELRRIPQDLRAADTQGRLFGDSFGESSVPIGIVIHPNGRVIKAVNRTPHFKDSYVAKCLSMVIRKLRFPRASKPTTLSFPFTIK